MTQRAQGRPFIIYRQPARSLRWAWRDLWLGLGILAVDAGVLWAVCAVLRWVVVRVGVGR